MWSEDVTFWKYGSVVSSLNAL